MARKDRYRVEIEGPDVFDNRTGAFREDECLPSAICSAVKGSHTITTKALLVGVVAWCVCNEEVEEIDRHVLAEWLSKTHVPGNMKELVNLTIGEDE